MRGNGAPCLSIGRDEEKMKTKKMAQGAAPGRFLVSGRGIPRPIHYLHSLQQVH
jgi:hypothetical protein